MGWTGGWRKPGSITSLKEKSPSSLPLPKLVSPDLPGVLVNYGKLDPGSSPGRWRRTGRAQCLTVLGAAHIANSKGFESVGAASQLFTCAQPANLWAPLDRGEAQGLQTRAFRNPCPELYGASPKVTFGFSHALRQDNTTHSGQFYITKEESLHHEQNSQLPCSIQLL